jgi:hypothetical protein
MLILKYNRFLKGDAWLAFDFPVIVDPLLRLKERLCRYQGAVVEVYLSISDALPPNLSINIGEFNDQVFQHGGDAGISLR